MSWLKEKLRIREQLKELNQITDFLMAHLKEWENRKTDIQPDIFEATKFLLQTLIDSYCSLHTLYTKKHFESSIVIARTILENSINLRYIFKEDSIRRAHNFILFPAKGYLDRIENSKEKDNPKLKDTLLILKREMQTYNPTGSKSNHWDGKNVYALFKELNLEEFYTEGYTRLSGYIHPEFKLKVDLQVGRPYFGFIKKLIFRDILIITLGALKIINEKYDLLEGGMIIRDYPTKGSDTVVSVNNKEY